MALFPFCCDSLRNWRINYTFILYNVAVCKALQEDKKIAFIILMLAKFFNNIIWLLILAVDMGHKGFHMNSCLVTKSVLELFCTTTSFTCHRNVVSNQWICIGKNRMLGIFLFIKWESHVWVHFSNSWFTFQKAVWDCLLALTLNGWMMSWQMYTRIMPFLL